MAEAAYAEAGRDGMRTGDIDATIAELRSLHAELRAPLTWQTMTTILRREGISLLRLPLRHDAQVISCDGISVMAINSNAPTARHTYYAAHEYGHIKLHFRDGEIVYHTSACWPDDPREDDAEYFATQLLMGPDHLAVSAESSVVAEGTVTRYGDDAPVVSRPRRRAKPKPSPSQTTLPLPVDPAPPFSYEAATGQTHMRHSSDPEDHVRYLTRRANRGSFVARDRAERSARETMLDLRPRIEFVKEGRKWYFVARDGVRWRVYDILQPSGRSSKTAPFPVEPPHNWATERAFVRQDGLQRRYQFAFRETHELETEHLERQLSGAK